MTCTDTSTESGIRPELQRQLGEVFTRRGFDALLFPTTPCPAPLIEPRPFTISGVEVSELTLARRVEAVVGKLPALA